MGLLQNVQLVQRPVIPRKTAAHRAAVFRGNPSLLPGKRIATPVCALARNDRFVQNSYFATGPCAAFSGTDMKSKRMGRDGPYAHKLHAPQPLLVFVVYSWRIKFYFATGANRPRTSPARAAGATSTWAPIFPALTVMASSPSTLWSKTVGNCFFMPTGEQPPWT